VVALRHLGIFQEIATLPAELGRHCLAHIKALAGIDTIEHRRPLDGRWMHDCPDQQRIDLRISVLPTLYGEDINLRLLNRQSQFLALDKLGLVPDVFNQLTAMLQSPSGLILVAGPTGAGKTTTLYAALHDLRDGKRKINTIEDPIEYALPGIRQAQINPHVDVGFPELLRSVLRQAPDIIMIGEIRDSVTAETAVRAANSGHLVLATLHAPGAASAVQSLYNLGVSTHFLGTALLGVVAQRLVRTLCPACRLACDMSYLPLIFEEVAPWLGPGVERPLFAAQGCPACRQSGYAGRTGVFEVLGVSASLRHLMYKRATIGALHRQACADGMLPFRVAALIKMAEGETTAEEALRVFPANYLAERANPERPPGRLPRRRRRSFDIAVPEA
jgi:general secretion pathway protein E